MKLRPCQTAPMSVRKWLTCWVCWEIKVGLGLLLLSKVLLFWGLVPVRSVRWRIGLVLLWAAVACLVYGLIRDCWSLARTIRARMRKAHEDVQRKSGG